MQQTPRPEISDKELTKRITSDLIYLPDEIRQAEASQAQLTASLNAAKRAVEEAETEALINAPVGEAKNDDARKKANAAAQLKDPSARAARKVVAELEAAIGAAGVDISALKRRWQASIALAEFQAARINLMAKFTQSDKSQERNTQ